MATMTSRVLAVYSSVEMTTAGRTWVVESSVNGKGTSTTSPRDAIPLSPVVVLSVLFVFPVSCECPLRQLQPREIFRSHDDDDFRAVWQPHVWGQLDNISLHDACVGNGHPVSLT